MKFRKKNKPLFCKIAALAYSLFQLNFGMNEIFLQMMFGGFFLQGHLLVKFHKIKNLQVKTDLQYIYYLFSIDLNRSEKL